MPWFIGTIYIIIQNLTYIISWLDLKNHQIKIIEPKDIVPKKFNSYYVKEIIELYLDKIPNISERFILLNHNHFFNHYIHPRFFFNADFYPKYNFSPGLNSKSEIITPEIKSFFKTYDLIKYFFGQNYINNYRFLFDAPISLYRDLFRPVRKLYMSKILHSFKQKEILLPLYLLCTYNIYGTAQIYYPNYVSGFGEIRNSPLPSIKKSNTILYYGFDITSENILKKSILTINSFKDVNENLLILKKSKALFFSLKFFNNMNNNEFTINFKFLRRLYKFKSTFEK